MFDRPNPLGVLRSKAAVDADKTSFIGYMVLPVRHGMTLGELARYFNVENGIEPTCTSLLGPAGAVTTT
jgi:uncharacterized protein YbbC (DUF1343 family)